MKKILIIVVVGVLLGLGGVFYFTGIADSWFSGGGSAHGAEAAATSASKATPVAESVVEQAVADTVIEEAVVEVFSPTELKDYKFQGSGTKSDPYLISTAKDMWALSYATNSGNAFSGVHFKMTGDIDLGCSAENQWTAIGSKDNQFGGHFAGGGFEVKRLYIDNELDYQGLFGYIGEGGSVSNLGVSGYIKGGEYVGGVVGYVNRGRITNCYNTGKVSVSVKDEEYFCVGGVAGVNHGTITNCYNTGKVSGNCRGGIYVGGVAGNNHGTITNCYNTGRVNGIGDTGNVGGIAGRSNGNITNCYNTGEVYGKTAGWYFQQDIYINTAGGVVGKNDYKGTIISCYNTGKVSGAGEYARIGGVIGYNSGTVINCNNTSEVYCEREDIYNENMPEEAIYYASVGGVVGENYYKCTIINCYNTGRVSGTGECICVGGVVGINHGTITNCYNIGGVVSDKNKYICVGGVAGYNEKGETINCYLLEGCVEPKGEHYVNGTVKTEEEMKSAEFVSELNRNIEELRKSEDEDIAKAIEYACQWAQDTTPLKNNGYPVFSK